MKKINLEGFSKESCKKYLTVVLSFRAHKITKEKYISASFGVFCFIKVTIFFRKSKCCGQSRWVCFIAAQINSLQFRVSQK